MVMGRDIQMIPCFISGLRTNALTLVSSGEVEIHNDKATHDSFTNSIVQRILRYFITIVGVGGGG